LALKGFQKADGGHPKGVFYSEKVEKNREKVEFFAEKGLKCGLKGTKSTAKDLERMPKGWKK